MRPSHCRRLFLAGALGLLGFGALHPQSAASAGAFKLPYPGGVTYRVSQGNNGSSHQGLGYYAFDFAMPVGSKVAASRSGKVTMVKKDSNIGGCSSAYGNAANYVVINHGDGTQSLYLHLQYNSAVVKVNDVVQQGQVIAKSGNTGWSCGAHLHYQVERAGTSWWTQSVASSFADIPTNNGMPVAGRSYTSGNYLGGPAPTTTPTPAATSTPTATASATPAPAKTEPPAVTPTGTPAGKPGVTPTVTSTPPSGDTGSSGGGAAPPPPAPDGQGAVDVSTGGAVSLEGIVTVNIPAEVIASSSLVTATISETVAPAAMPPAGRYPGSAVFTVALTDAGGAPVTQVTQGLGLIVPYEEDDLDLTGGDPVRLGLFRFEPESQSWTDLQAVVDVAVFAVKATTDRPGLFALMAGLPAPKDLTGPANGMVYNDGAPLAWTNPPGVTQYHLQVLPANMDGPGLNLIIGRSDLVQQAQFQLPSPQLGSGNYILLPGMTYTWRVRTTSFTAPLGENDPGWSEYATAGFATAAPASATISPVSPSQGGVAGSPAPALQWRNANSSIFYYEVQLSRDPSFTVDPAAATAAVYWNLVHGGVTSPLNSWTVPEGAALDTGQTYYWRVRPRVQGDGQPADWSTTWSFRTPG